MNNKASIIDMILKNQKSEAVEIADEKKMVITPEAFFKTHCTKEQFSTLLNSITRRELQGLDFVFGLMKEGKRFNVTPFEAYDKNNNPYIWVDIVNKKTTSGLKVRTTGKMWNLIGLYGMGVVTFECSLEDLYNHLSKE